MEIVMVVLVWLNEFLASTSIYFILLLIVLDFIFGVAEALKTKVFDWEAVSDFLITNILPYVIVYVGLQLAFRFIELPLEEYISPMLISGVFVTIVGSLVASITRHLSGLGLNLTKQ